jgi:Na+-driven multidrug efflux pump
MSDVVAGPTTPVPLRRIVALAAPLALSGVVVLGAQLVAIGIVGRIGDAALYVRSVYLPAAFLFMAVTVGLGVTVQVAVARAAGRGAPGEVSRHLTTVARLAAIVQPVVGAALIGAVWWFGDALAIAPEHRGLLELFLLAMTAAGAVSLCGELCAAALRGLGRGSASTALTATFAVLNLVVVAVAGFGAGAGLMAVPIGFGVAGAAELTVGLFLLRRGGNLRSGWRVRDAATTRLVRSVGFPVAGSYLTLFVVNALMLRIVAPSGQATVAGFASGYLLQTLLIVPGIGLGSAVAVLMNQRPDAAPGIFRRGLALVVGSYAAVTLLLLAVGRPLASLLSDNPDIVAAAWRYLAVVGPTFGCTGVVLAVLTVLEQVGHGPLALGMTIFYFATILVVGALTVAASRDVGDLYRTIAVAAAISVVTAPAIALFVLPGAAPRRDVTPVRS